MKRHKLTLDEVQYILSESQLTMLSRKRLTPKDPSDWNFNQRIKSLVRQGLSRKRNGSYERTRKGFEVWKQIADRNLKRGGTNITVIAPSQ